MDRSGRSRHGTPSGVPGGPWPALVALMVLSMAAGAGLGLFTSLGRQPAVPATAPPPTGSQPVVEVRPPSPEDVLPGVAGGTAGGVLAETLADPAGLAGAASGSATGLAVGGPPGSPVGGTGGAAAGEALGREPGSAGAGLPGDVSAGAPPGASGGTVPADAAASLRPPSRDPTVPLPDRGAGPGTSPRIAIIIDDWGYDWAAADSFLSFPEPLTVAVLPFLPRSTEQALRAQAAGFEVIVHMPMEAQDGSLDIGPGGVYVSMDDEEIAAAVQAAVNAVPGARGLNNHMGSRATMDARVMRAALQVLADRNLFFVDSFTIPTTVGYRVARDMQLPYAVNQVFLDSVDDVEAIRQQIRRVINLALRDGAAVAIGHVRSRTYTALMDMLPEIRAAGVRFVPVSELLTRPATVAGSSVAAAPSRVAQAVESPATEQGEDLSAAAQGEQPATSGQGDDPSAAGRAEDLSRDAQGDDPSAVEQEEESSVSPQADHPASPPGAETPAPPSVPPADEMPVPVR